VALNDLERRNGHFIAYNFTEFGTFGANYVTVLQVIHILSATKMYPNESTRCGIISGPPCNFWPYSSGNYCPNLMILSTLWTEKICIQAQSKICHHTLILLLHYLAQTMGVYVTTKALRFYHIAFQQRVKN